MSIRASILVALALVAAPLVPSATAAEEAAFQTVVALPVHASDVPGRGVVTDARAKGFRSASRVLVIVGNCNAVGYPNATRVDILDCSVRTDTGAYSNAPGSFPAPAGAQVNRVNLAGNKLVQVCVRARVYFSTGAPTYTTPLNCSGSILIDV